MKDFLPIKYTGVFVGREYKCKSCGFEEYIFPSGNLVNISGPKVMTHDKKQTLIARCPKCKSDRIQVCGPGHMDTYT